MGISSANPHETSLIHLDNRGGLKGLLHVLNATLILTTMSEVFSCFVFVSLEDE